MNTRYKRVCRRESLLQWEHGEEVWFTYGPATFIFDKKVESSGSPYDLSEEAFGYGTWYINRSLPMLRPAYVVRTDRAKEWKKQRKAALDAARPKREKRVPGEGLTGYFNWVDTLRPELFMVFMEGLGIRRQWVRRCSSGAKGRAAR